jgi:hypothetical protein
MVHNRPRGCAIIFSRVASLHAAVESGALAGRHPQVAAWTQERMQELP